MIYIVNPRYNLHSLKLYYLASDPCLKTLQCNESENILLGITRFSLSFSVLTFTVFDDCCCCSCCWGVLMHF